MSDPTPHPGLLVVYDEVETQDDAKGLSSTFGSIVRKIAPLETDALAISLQYLCSEFEKLFDKAAAAGALYQLSSFEVMVDFSAKGEIRLIGSASSEFRGGLKLTFSKKT